MTFLTPEAIAAKAENIYGRFIKEWIFGSAENYFPHRVNARFSIDPRNSKGTIQASEMLLAKSKVGRGWGYTVHREQVRMRDFGNNPVPSMITIDTLEDLLRLANRKDEFLATCRVVSLVREAFPQLENWLRANIRLLHRYVEPIVGLIQVAQFFVKNPWPDCYARQIPVFVDTKFIQRHAAILREWLDLILSPSAIDVNENVFALRFGLRDGQPHRAVRVLDSALTAQLGLPFDELSLPLRSIAAMPAKNVTAFIVENDLNLLTLPRFPRGIGIRGEGNAVNRLERVTWFHDCRLYYWGDIDVEGFQILSRLRSLFPAVESILMDLKTIEQHEEMEGNGTTPTPPTNLTPPELAAFEYCVDRNARLEQEKIPQPFVDRVFAELTEHAGGDRRMCQTPRH